jgi:hypothetical protein
MIVFLINHKVTKATLWWDGSDSAVQTQYAYKNVYFTGDDTAGNKLDNGKIVVDFSNFSGDNGYVKSTTKTSPVDSTCTFSRVNSKYPTYGSQLSYTIHHGVVRDIIQQEPEWSGGVTSSPDFYGLIVLTIPANTNYYTFRTRIIYVTTNQARDLSDLSIIQLKAPTVTGTYNQLTEDGVSSGKPQTSGGTLFYDGGTAHQHQWSEYISTSDRGTGVIMRSNFNNALYIFDNVNAYAARGAISIDTTNQKIELNPIAPARAFPVNGFKQSADISWVGAIINFSSGVAVDTIYPSPFIGGNVGLWVLVEYPPNVSIS